MAFLSVAYLRGVIRHVGVGVGVGLGVGVGVGVGLGIGVGVWGHLALEAVEELAAGQVVEDHVQLAW